MRVQQRVQPSVRVRAHVAVAAARHREVGEGQHVVLAVPFAFKAAEPLSPQALRRLAIACALYYISTTYLATVELRNVGELHGLGKSLNHSLGLIELWSDLVGAAARNLCQASISTDAVLSSITGLAFVCLSDSVRYDWRSALLCCLLTPVVGPAAALAMHYVWQQDKEGSIGKAK